jgi:3-hydroxyacyl-CoA dehydrogenase
MHYSIRRAAVIGAGTMGGGIAALLAGVGIPVDLLDIAAKDTQPGDPAAKRSAPAAEGVNRLKTGRPAQLFAPADLDLIRIGNLEDDLGRLADADWIIEVVVERLDVKQALMARVLDVAKPTAILSSNTSGLPIRQIADGLGSGFSRRFMGTHFFNPPRYLYLLELIPHPDTDPALVAFMRDFATRTLGKGVVVCKDEPNFIGNRFMSMSGTQLVNDALDHGFTVEEVDALTGKLIGRPNTATFRLNDLVGIDVAVHVARNLYPAIANDPARGVLEHAAMNALFDRLLANGWLGNKSGQGFYRQMRGAGGEKEFWSLNLSTFEYEPPGKPRFESVSKHRRIEDTGARIKALLGETDRAAQLLWRHHAFLLAYASQRVPEITDTLVNIDDAQKWGFAHELGPFEIWDAIGVAEHIAPFEAAGYPVADWVKRMVADGFTTFYQRDEHGIAVGYYDVETRGYLPFAADPRAVHVPMLAARPGGVVARNAGASLIDLGDDVLLFDLHAPAQALDTDVLEMGEKAAALLETGWAGMVVASQAERFCVGANLFMIMLSAQAEQWDVLDAVVARSQAMMQRLRTAARPVVIAPHNLALGGGTELMMAGTRIVAHAELYSGLVEVGVGVIPGSGGCKEMLRRIVNPVMRAHPNADVLPHLQKVFENIALAKVSESAKAAREMGILGPCDRIVLNRAHLVSQAKREVVYLADGFVPAQSERVYAAGRDAYAALLAAIEGFREAGTASEHDAVIARELAFVLTGGAPSEPGWVSEATVLDLEREAFLRLLRQPKTQERIGHMLQTNKPLRN